jgi:hypothetical protein
MTREGCKEKKKKEEEEDKKEQGEGEETQVRCWNVFRNLLVEGDNNIFAKLLQVVQRRRCKSPQFGEDPRSGRVSGLIEKISIPEAHTPLLERIKELQLGLHTLSFDSAAYRDMEAKINKIQGKILKSDQMAFLFINRLLTSHSHSDKDLKERACPYALPRENSLRVRFEHVVLS